MDSVNFFKCSAKVVKRYYILKQLKDPIKKLNAVRLGEHFFGTFRGLVRNKTRETVKECSYLHYKQSNKQ